MKTIVAGGLPKRNLFSYIFLLRWLKKSTLVEIIAILYMSMFLYTAISKWSDITMTREQMALMPLMTPIAHIVIWLLPATEIAITLLIYFHQTRKRGLYAATFLMILFTIYIIYMMLFYPKLPCSCGGFLTELSWPGHLVFNGVFIVLGILAIRIDNKINGITQKKINRMRLQTCSLLFMALAWIACQNEKPQQAYKTGMEGKPLPAFAIQLLDSTSFIHTEDLPKDKSMVLFYFSPTCPYCRAQMRDMVNNIDRFKDRELCILTNADLKSINGFAEYFNLKGLNNVIVGRDTGSVVLIKYQLMTVPFTAYFDKNKQLKSAYTGRMSPNSLFQF